MTSVIFTKNAIFRMQFPEGYVFNALIDTLPQTFFDSFKQRSPK